MSTVDLDVDEEMEFFLYVQINSTEKRKEDGAKKEHTVYKIEVSNNTKEWEVYRRYSEFDQLLTTLEQKYPERPMPDFPLKTLWGELDPGVVEKRRTMFAKFLEGVLSDPFMNRSEDLMKFLGAEIPKSYTETVKKSKKKKKKKKKKKQVDEDEDEEVDEEDLED